MTKFFLRLSVLILCAASAAHAVETFPVVHHEPITLRVLDGRDGRPLAHVRLQLVGGYNARDLAIELWYGEAVTNAAGEARLPDDMVNLPFLRVGAANEKLCQPGGRHGSLSVERIRLEGFSMPNHCGVAAVANAPGVFILYAKGSGPADSANLTAAASSNLSPDNGVDPASRAERSIVAAPDESAGSGSSPQAGELPQEPDAEGTAAALAAYQQMCQPDE